MIYALLSAELILLFILSRAVSVNLSMALYRLFHSQKITIYIVAFLFFPGVLIHEIAHWLMAQLLFVPTGKVEFLPVLRGSELKLGSVAIAQTDPIRRALIGVAPFLLGTVILLVTLFSYANLDLIPQSIKLYVVGYMVFEIGNTMFSSRKDLEGTIELLIAVAIICLALYVIGVRLPPQFFDFFTTNEALVFARQSAVFIAVPVVLDIIIVVLLRILLKLAR